MGEKTGIAWADHTLIFWRGCDPVSDGCDHCYWTERDALRFGHDPHKLVRASDATFYRARIWDHCAAEAGATRFVFPCSWSDFFHPGADEWRADAWEVIRQTPHLMWLILTKRPEMIADRLPADWGSGWPNVALGVTCEAQKYAHRIMVLLDLPAARRFVSIEPMLGAVDLTRLSQLDWVIVGGETGRDARPMHPDSVRGVRDQCVAAGVPFFFKSWGEYNLMDGNVWGYSYAQLETVQWLDADTPMIRVGRKRAGNVLDGRVWEQRMEVGLCQP